MRVISHSKMSLENFGLTCEIWESNKVFVSHKKSHLFIPSSPASPPVIPHYNLNTDPLFPQLDEYHPKHNHCINICRGYCPRFSRFIKRKILYLVTQIQSISREIINQLIQKILLGLIHQSSSISSYLASFMLS